MKIILIGNNTADNQPHFFLKPDSALLKDNKPFFIPDFTKQLRISMHPVIRISRLGKNIAERFAGRYYDAITMGLDFTATDLQNECRENNQPWDISYSFDGSAVIGHFLSKDKYKTLQALHFKLLADGKTVQQLSPSELSLSPDQIVSWVSQFHTLKTGDLIFCGNISSTSGYIDELLQGYIEEEKVFDFHIR